MFENIGSFFKKIMKSEQKELLVEATSKDAAKERLHIVLMQDRANVSADFLELMKQEIIDVIKKYIVIDEEQIDVRLTNQENDDGTTGAPALYANIPIINIRNDIKGEYLNQDDAKEKVIENNASNIISNETNSKIDSEIENNIIPNLDMDLKINEENISELNENININNINRKEQKYNDEEDDDITFDDLLKVAEEEERLSQNENKNTENNNEQKKEDSKQPLPKSIKMSNKATKNSTKKKSKKSNKR